MALADEVMHGMVMTKLKIMLALTLMTCALATGVIARQPTVPNQADARQTDEQRRHSLVGEAPVPARDQTARTDRYSDPLPPGAAVRIGTVRLRHGGEISSVAFSPDGKRVASAGRDGVLRFWDAATGKEVLRLPAEGKEEYAFDLGCIWSIALSPNGKTVATGHNDTTIRLSDVATGRALWRVRVPQAWVVECVAFSPDGQVLASGARLDPTVRLWDAATGTELRRLVGHEGAAIHAVAFSPDGKSLASGGEDATVRLWEVATGKELRRISLPPKDRVSSLAFSPNGRVLASAGFNSMIRLWEVAAGKALRQWAGATHLVQAVTFSPDGKVLASAGDDLRVWDVETGKEVCHCAGVHRSLCRCAAFSWDGRTLVSGSSAGSLQFWDPMTGAEVHPVGVEGIGNRSLVFSYDGRTLASSREDGEVFLWDAATGRELGRLAKEPKASPGFQSPSLGLGNDGKTLLSGDPAGSIHVWDLATRNELRSLQVPLDKLFRGNGDSPRYLYFSPDWKIVACATKQFQFYLLNAATGKQLCPNGPIQDQVPLSTAFSPDSTILATGHYRIIRLWEVATGRELRRLSQPEAAVTSLAFAPNGRLMASGSDTDGTVRVWDVTTGREQRRLSWHSVLTAPPKMQVHLNGLVVFAFSQDSRTLACAYSDRTIRLWELASGQERRRLAGHEGLVSSLAFSPAGRLLASSDNAAILIWNRENVSGERRLQLGRLSRLQVEGLWTELGTNAARAEEAIWSFVLQPGETVGFLRERLRPASKVDSHQTVRLLADLESNQFGIRQRATKELETLGARAEVELRRALAKNPSLESRQRIVRLLEKLEEPMTAPDALRILRGVEVLEYIGTSEARGVLETLAKGAPEARLTREAKASVERLTKRVAATSPYR